MPDSVDPAHPYWELELVLKAADIWVSLCHFLGVDHFNFRLGQDDIKVRTLIDAIQYVRRDFNI